MNADIGVYVGIDWADARHAVCILDGDRLEQGALLQEAGALDEWAAALRTRFGGRPVAVCLEASRGPLVSALMKSDFRVLFPLNPKQLASSRAAFRPSGGKCDPGDAELLARFLREHHARLRPWRPDDAATRSLRMLGAARRQWVDPRTAAGNRLIQALKEAYPLAFEFQGKHVYGERFLQLLAKFPTQQELQRANPKLLIPWFTKLRYRVDDPPPTPAADPRVVKIRQAPALVTDAAVLRANRWQVVHLVKLLQQFNATLAEFDEQLSELTRQHPDAEWFRSFPGAGDALTPRLIAAFGTDRERYASSEDVQQLSGIAPVRLQSGKSCVVKKRLACPAFLRQTFHEHARCSLLSCRWTQAYCRMQKARGMPYHAAVRSLAFKWLRIMYACWRRREAYDDAKYMAQLHRKESPLLAYLPPPPTQTV